MSIRSTQSANPDLRNVPTTMYNQPPSQRLSNQSLTGNQKNEIPLRNTQPLDGGKPRRASRGGNVIVQVIDENQEYSFTSPQPAPMGRGSNRSSATSEKIARKHSQQQRPINGVSNAGFAGSTASSLHGGSLNSLPVIREQYCCCSRWSKLERNLLLVVGILAAIIIGLLVAVTVISSTRPRDGSSNRWWAL